MSDKKNIDKQSYKTADQMNIFCFIRIVTIMAE